MRESLVLKTRFPRDAHDIVMLVRTTVEIMFFIILVIFSSKIPWVQRWAQLRSFQYGVSAALFFSLVFLVFTIRQRYRDESVRVITYFESIADAFMIIWLIFIFGGMNGPFFFFFFLALMEGAFTLSFPVVFAILIMGVSSAIGGYVFKVTSGSFVFDVSSLVFLFFRVLTMSLISYYSYSFIKSIVQERETGQKLNIAYKELKRTDQLKSEFLSMSSHQLRTPLTVIRGYLSMTLEGDYGKVPSKIRKVLNNVFTASQRLVKIVEDLLNISRIDLGKMELEKSIVKITDLLQSCYEEMKIRSEEKGLKMVYEKLAKALPDVYADESKIRQVVLNLVDNAIRYTPKGEITISVEKKNNHILIKVSDTGVGLSKKEQKNIFEGFTRGSAGINYFTEGAGLGLYVSKKYLDLHKGKIWCKSPGKNKGSTFFVELPIS